MSETCRDYQELFPLFIVDRLNSVESEQVRKHLESCDECSAVYQEESALMKLAMTKVGVEQLVDHPEIDELSLFATKKTELSEDRVTTIKSHLSQCETCVEVVSRLRDLPSNLDELISSDRIPILSALSVEAETWGASPIQTVARRAVWTSIARYAVAATILLVGVISISNILRSPSTLLTIKIPATLRGVDDSLIFISPTPTTIVELTYFLAPEPNHKYDIEVSGINSKTRIWQQRDFSDFDERGIFKAELTMDTGFFRLTILDIAPTDSVTYQREFQIRLLEK